MFEAANTRIDSIIKKVKDNRNNFVAVRDFVIDDMDELKSYIEKIIQKFGE